MVTLQAEGPAGSQGGGTRASVPPGRDHKNKGRETGLESDDDGEGGRTKKAPKKEDIANVEDNIRKSRNQRARMNPTKKSRLYAEDLDDKNQGKSHMLGHLRQFATELAGDEDEDEEPESQTKEERPPLELGTEAERAGEAEGQQPRALDGLPSEQVETPEAALARTGDTNESHL
jgi:hypothetical protein